MKPFNKKLIKPKHLYKTLKNPENCDISSIYFFLMSCLILKKKIDNEKFFKLTLKFYNKKNGYFKNNSGEKCLKLTAMSLICLKIVEINFCSDCKVDNPFCNNFLKKIISIGFDKTKILINVNEKYNFDGGFSFEKGCESHLGYTYSALIIYKILDINKDKFLDKESIVNHLKILGRFKGRINKDNDSCYIYWGIACRKILDKVYNEKIFTYSTVKGRDKKFLLKCYKNGGFSRDIWTNSDIIHTFYVIISDFVSRDIIDEIFLIK